MITEDYVSFEIAKLLKEKGFKECCSHCYGIAVLYNGTNISFDEECELKEEGRENEIEYVEGGNFYNYGCNNSNTDANVWAAPTLWMAMKWLREEYNIHIEIHYLHKSEDYSYVINNVSNGGIMCVNGFDSYENAVEAAILECLTNLI